MQNKGFVKVFAVLLTLVCLFYLSFTYVASREDKKVEAWAKAQTESWVAEKVEKGEVVTDFSMKEKFNDFKNDYLEDHIDDKVWLGIYTHQECRELEIGLGLDLKGGLSVTLEVSAPDYLKSLFAGSKKEAVLAALEAAQNAGKDEDPVALFASTFADKGGNENLASLLAKSSLKEKVVGKDNNAVIEVIRAELANAVDNSFDVVRSRVDRFGVAQPNIQKVGGGQGRILVELPGEDDKDRVVDLLTRSSNLQFWKVYTAQEISAFAPALISWADDIVEVDDSLSVNPFAGAMEIGGNGVVTTADRERKKLIDKFLAKAKENSDLPEGLHLCWGADKKGGIYTLYALMDEDTDGQADLQGDVVVEATAGFDPENKPCVNMEMTGTAAAIWADLTEACARDGRPIAVVLDDAVYSAPVPSERIAGGRSVINGNFTIKETQDLAIVLCSGKMLVPMRAVESNVVGPSIGKESIQQGLTSFIVAFILLMVYMCLVYGLKPGMVANGALLLNLFFTLGILASFQATLTMAGIAGLVLTLGMAVDANVLIYERAKEELKAGKNVRAALADGYKNAFSAILDSNLTSIITGIILYYFGTGPIKGFAVTLIIGLLCSFFTAVFVTRVVYEHFHAKNKWMNLTFTTKFSRKMFQNMNVNFMKLSKKVGIAFVVLAVAMFVSFMVRGMGKSIEFTGGRNYVVKFEQKVSEGDVQKLVKAKVGEANVQVISYGTDGDQVRISTNYLIDSNRADAGRIVEETIYDALKEGGLLADNVVFEITNPDSKAAEGLKSFKDDFVMSIQEVDSTVAEEISDSAILSVILALIAIFIYILIRFRNVAYSVGAIFALALDVVMIMGCYSLLNGVLPMSLELDQIFIGAILTAIGYSINDKVVIFDRIREFAHIYPKRNKYELFNTSLNTTFARTMNTSISTLIVLLCIFFLGGDSVRSFSFAMILGVVFGTMSSIFVASPIAYKIVQFQTNRKAKKENK